MPYGGYISYHSTLKPTKVKQGLQLSPDLYHRISVYFALGKLIDLLLNMSTLSGYTPVLISSLASAFTGPFTSSAPEWAISCLAFVQDRLCPLHLPIIKTLPSILHTSPNPLTSVYSCQLAEALSEMSRC